MDDIGRDAITSLTFLFLSKQETRVYHAYTRKPCCDCDSTVREVESAPASADL